MCLSRRPTVNWTPSSDESSVSGDVDVDVTSLGDVTCLIIGEVLMNSFAFDSPSDDATIFFYKISTHFHYEHKQTLFL